jgi:hypothetical protein
MELYFDRGQPVPKIPKNKFQIILKYQNPKELQRLALGYWCLFKI